MTNLYLTTATQAGLSSAAEVTTWKLAGTAGASPRICNKNAPVGPIAPSPVTDSSTAGTDGNTLAWYSDPVTGVTIAGQIVASLWGVESASTTNAAPCIGVYRCSQFGAVLSAIVDQSAVGSQGALEFATTAGAKTCTVSAANVTDTILNTGDRLKVILYIDDAADQGGSGSLTGSGHSAQLYVNGATGGSGQSQIAFTETILSMTSPAVVFPAVAGRPVNPGREAPSIISGT